MCGMSCNIGMIFCKMGFVSAGGGMPGWGALSVIYY